MRFGRSRVQDRVPDSEETVMEDPAAETETLCGLDPDDAEAYGGQGLIKPGDATCPKCNTKASGPF